MHCCSLFNSRGRGGEKERERGGGGGEGEENKENDSYSQRDSIPRWCDICCYRYRNFRTFASPKPVQFSCLALDPSGEVVCAGSHDTFEIYVWSMQTGRLLEVRVAEREGGGKGKKGGDGEGNQIGWVGPYNQLVYHTLSCGRLAF